MGFTKGYNASQFLFFQSSYLATLVPGVGSIKPNGREDEDEDSEELEADVWMKLLNFGDDGILALKPWKEVAPLKANKTNTALALRAIIRQAWGEYILFYCHFSYLTSVT